MKIWYILERFENIKLWWYCFFQNAQILYLFDMHTMSPLNWLESSTNSKRMGSIIFLVSVPYFLVIAILKITFRFRRRIISFRSEHIYGNRYRILFHWQQNHDQMRGSIHFIWLVFNVLKLCLVVFNKGKTIDRICLCDVSGNVCSIQNIF